ncbi:MAG: DUF1285 domain-containing protein [Phenylobacterium sp.]|uniref:DUF1285 domain-containing protein n=1 Tax=Phenylobacterium sp. TaxID=1871053 RepID=UPI0027350DD4|nr:DUF1285 domain-containing protein [Phenylobacterium sp.]MDP1641020.1 DUF1285 domain-containing protein [Phenylobacterium sp.]MDP3117319.1 DUF1285 domain-containing protein [Phenylobacterium sp.]
MTELDSKPGLDGVIAAAKQAPGRGLPPVHLWNPAHSGEIDIVITADGRWVHEGATINRAPLVRLFSTVLRRDPDGYWLVTPVEKMKITVEDAPFIATALDAGADAEGRPVLRFNTNVGDEVEAGPEHLIRVEIDPATDEPRPYLHVRRGLEALISRPVFYELVEMAQERDGTLGVESGGTWFAIGPVEAPVS